jgi:GDP-L-fucose synthase
MDPYTFYAGKKVLVAGATGLIGANLVEELVRRGAYVRATLHRKPPVIKDPRIQYLKGDLIRREDCATAMEGVDYVFMCAANTSGAHVVVTNPLAHITENILINAQMLEAACLAKVERFLFMSSSTIYPPVTHPVKEEEAFVGDPHESYFGSAWMKRYFEKLAEFYYRRYGLKVVLVRPTNVYGPYDKFEFETSHVLPALIRRAVEKENPFEVWGDGTAVRDFIYATDMVDALLAGLEHLVGCDSVNIGSGQTVTIRESVEIILSLTGHANVEVIYDASKPTTIPTRLVDLSKAKTLLGFRPKVSFEEGLRRTINWYREYRGMLSPGRIT